MPGIRKNWLVLLIVSTILYLFLLGKIHMESQVDAGGENKMLMVVMVFQALCTYFLSFAIPLLMLSKFFLRKLIVQGLQGEDLTARVSLIYFYTIFGACVLTNVAVIFTYLGAAFGQSPAIFLPVAICGVFSIAIRFPTSKRFERVLARAKAL